MQLANAVGQGDRSTWDAIADVITEEQRKELEPEIWRFLKFATMMHQADQSAGPTPIKSERKHSVMAKAAKYKMQGCIWGLFILATLVVPAAWAILKLLTTLKILSL